MDEFHWSDHYTHVWESAWERDETHEAKAHVVKGDKGFHTMLELGDDDRDYVSPETYASKEEAIKVAQQELEAFFNRPSADLSSRRKEDVAWYEQSRNQRDPEIDFYR